MRKPYLRKYGKVRGFDVWIVDGRFIRNNIDVSFTNFGEHYSFSFIPKKELWIDRQAVPGEENFYIENLLTENRLMRKGVPYTKTKLADEKEKRLRERSGRMKKIMKLPAAQRLKLVHKKLIKKYSKKISVWVVDGELVRDLFLISYAEGGHDVVYRFIPRNEIWIDDDLRPGERKFILLHELHERNRMLKGETYDQAHPRANEVELFARRHPRKAEEMLSAELDKI